MAQPGRDGIQVLANLVLKHIDKLVLFYSSFLLFSTIFQISFLLKILLIALKDILFKMNYILHFYRINKKVTEKH